jgi:hypothetical protein
MNHFLIFETCSLFTLCIKGCPAFVNTFNQSLVFIQYSPTLNTATFTNKTATLWGKFLPIWSPWPATIGPKFMFKFNCNEEKLCQIFAEPLATDPCLMAFIHFWPLKKSKYNRFLVGGNGKPAV